jgi:hypothetical protein
LDLAQLGFDQANLELEDLGDLESFWEDAAEDIDKIRSDALSLEEAKKLGLLSDESEEE